MDKKTLEIRDEIHDYSDWEPQDYLAEYYQEVMPDEQFALEFLVESLQKMPSTSVT